MIKLYSVVLKESPLDSPFVPKSKCSGAAGWQAAAAVFGDLLNYTSQENANRVSEKIAHENMDMQDYWNKKNMDENRYLLGRNEAFTKQMQELTNQFNIEQWKRNNAYNEPSQVVQRLLNAGVNPASYFGSAATSSPVSSVSPSSPVSHGSNAVAPQNTFAPRAPQLHPEYAINAFNQSQLANAQTKEIEARAHNIDLSSDLMDKSLDYQVETWKHQAEGEGIQAELARKRLAFVGATLDYDIKLRYGQTLEQDQALKNMKEQYHGMQLQNDILDITKSYADQLNRAQIAQIWHTVNQIDANIGLINANKLLTDEQRNNEVQKVIGTKIDNGLKGINYDVQKNIKQFLIQDAQNRANIGIWDAYDKWKYNPHGDNRPVSDQFGVDFTPDFMSRTIKAHHYVPKL